MEAAQPICIAFSNTDVSKSEVLISSNAIGVTGGNEGIITIPRFAGDWGVYRIVFFDKGLSVNAIVWFWVNSNALFTWKGELEEKVKNTLTISKSNPYSTVVVIISNNDSLFFYIDSTFRGEKIKDNPSCTVERIDNSKFRIIHNSYGKVLIFSVGSFNCSVTK